MRCRQDTIQQIKKITERRTNATIVQLSNKTWNHFIIFRPKQAFFSPINKQIFAVINPKCTLKKICIEIT